MQRDARKKALHRTLFVLSTVMYLAWGFARRGWATSTTDTWQPEKGMKSQVSVTAVGLRRRQNLARKYGVKWALVTGASSGIGLAIVEALAAQVRACETLSRRGHGRLLRYVMSTWGYLEPILECFRSPRHQAEWHCSSAAHPRPLLAGCLPADTARRVHVSPTSIAELVARISHCCALGPGG